MTEVVATYTNDVTFVTSFDVTNVERSYTIYKVRVNIKSHIKI